MGLYPPGKPVIQFYDIVRGKCWVIRADPLILSELDDEWSLFI